MSHLRAIPWVAAALLVLPTSAEAQSNRSTNDGEAAVVLVGEVIDRSTGEPIPSARIALTSLGDDGEEVWVGSSDASGSFRSNALPLGGYLVEVDALTFPSLAESVILAEPGTVDLAVEMVPVDYELDPIVAVGTPRGRLEDSGFYQRRRAQGGTFLSRAEILAEGPVQVSDLFRTMPGVRVVPDQSGLGSAVRLRRSCVPQVVLDGVSLVPPVSIDNLVSPQDLEGIEVHQGLTGPVRFAGPNTCGQIMLWTRDPGDSGQSIGSLLKIWGAAAFVAVAVIATN